MNYKIEYERWLNEEKVPHYLKAELRGLTDEKEIEDRFYKNLEFGTGGLRGKIAAGSNRLNSHTIAKATQGLANYLMTVKQNPRIAIAYDSRNRSAEFADTAAGVLAATGVKVFLYESLRPTPMLSFAVRHLKTDAGIVITASHNPKEYNGYKVYGSDGGQVTDYMAKKVLSCMERVAIFEDVKTMDLKEAKAKGLLEYIGKEVDEAYYKKVEMLCIRKDLIKEKAKAIRIIYTPIHGSGNIPVRTMLRRLGFDAVQVVKEQELPNGNFPTVSYPNPENKAVFELAIEMAKQTSPDLIFGTDPDCDRIGVVVKERSGGYKVLTGNQVGVLLTDYVLKARREKEILSLEDTIIKTIVSSEMASAVAKHYGAQVVNVLTGFKYIGEKVQECLDTKNHKFILGFEESYGYLLGDFVRDKDAVIASVLIAEMALYHKTKGKSLYEALQTLFKQYGYYKEDLMTITMEGKDGQRKIATILETIRENMPTQIGDTKIVRIEDYKLSIAYNLLKGTQESIHLPTSNVIKFLLEDGKWFVIRPSGTEPKMKIYISVIGANLEDAEAQAARFTKEIFQIYEDIEHTL